MGNQPETPTSSRSQGTATRTRRSYLTTIAALGSASLAGCLGGSGGGNTSSPDTTYACEWDATESEGPTPRVDMATVENPTLGPSSAGVTIEVFEDFACPHCRDFTLGPLKTVKADYIEAGDVQLRHYDYPLPVSKWSRPVANIGRYIQTEIDDVAFFDFAKRAYENQDAYSWQTLGDIVSGFDQATPCEGIGAGNYGTFDAVIEADVSTGDQREIPGTPAVFVNGTLTDPTEQALTDAIEDAISDG